MHTDSSEAMAQHLTGSNSATRLTAGIYSRCYIVSDRGALSCPVATLVIRAQRTGIYDPLDSSFFFLFVKHGTGLLKRLRTAAASSCCCFLGAALCCARFGTLKIFLEGTLEEGVCLHSEP